MAHLSISPGPSLERANGPPISLMTRLQTNRVRPLMDTLFQKPLLNHLNGEPCPPTPVVPRGPLLTHYGPTFPSGHLPTSQAQR